MTNTADPKAPPSRAAPSDRDNPPPEYLAFLTILKRVTHPPRGIEFQPMTNIKEELDRCFNDDPEDEEMRACPRPRPEVHVVTVDRPFVSRATFSVDLLVSVATLAPHERRSGYEGTGAL